MHPSRFLHRKLHRYGYMCWRAHGTAALRGNRRLRSAATLCSSSRQPVLGIRREESSVWERRAPLNPNQVQIFTREGVKVGPGEGGGDMHGRVWRVGKEGET